MDCSINTTMATSTRHRNRTSRSLRDDLGGLTEVCFGGGKGGDDGGEVRYTRSPEERKLYREVIPTLRWIYGGKKPREDLYDIPRLRFNLPKITGPDISKYIPGGEQYEAVYGKIAPTLWESYERSVENPLVNRFAGSGTLGSPVAGLSGAAADALEASRRKAESTIAGQAFQQAMQPLMTDYSGDLQTKMAQYGAQVNAAMQGAMKPWEAMISQREYPYQILPGLISGSMPQPVVRQGGGGKK